MGHSGKAKKCPPTPWHCELKAGSKDYLYIVDAEGEVVGSLWGPVERTYPAARLLEALTRCLRPEQVAHLARPFGAGPGDDSPEVKAERDERARLRGIRMRKQRMMQGA